ncbi:MAG: dipeptide epimerase [Pseudomonadales bacterium]|nr:dipeptide epimerase [Pseudomonadales bacterium]NIX06852.1 dipeptide epimerase [Pseudomonadales bacterium]
MDVFAHTESWPIAGTFTIARGSKTAAEVIVVTVRDGGLTGMGECLPYPRYGQTPQGTLEDIRAAATERGKLDRERLQALLPAGPARNAIDCALWDLEARQRRQPVWELAGLPEPVPVVTALTIVLAEPAQMREAAERHSTRSLLKIKLGAGAERDVERLRAVRSGAPDARLIVDANEGWSLGELERVAPVAADLGVEMIEQPLPATEDEALDGYRSPVPLGADESLHARTDLEALSRRYRVANIKLDKTGGLTAAISLQKRAEALGMDIMVGCMVATSLAMAPALLLAQTARFVDLDGPLLLVRDRLPGLVYRDSRVGFPRQALWGAGKDT